MPLAASCWAAATFVTSWSGLGIRPLVLEDQPAVEAGEVVGVGQPDVDDGEAARCEMAAIVDERLALGRPRCEQEERVQGDERQPERAGRRQIQAEQVGLDELDPVTRAVPAGLARSRARASIAGSTSTAVTPWPASASGTLIRPVPAPSSRIGPPVRAASAR